MADLMAALDEAVRASSTPPDSDFESVSDPPGETCLPPSPMSSLWCSVFRLSRWNQEFDDDDDDDGDDAFQDWDGRYDSEPDDDTSMRIALEVGTGAMTVSPTMILCCHPKNMPLNFVASDTEPLQRLLLLLYLLLVSCSCCRCGLRTHNDAGGAGMTMRLRRSTSMRIA